MSYPTDIVTPLFIVLGGFANDNYWGSTEINNGDGWEQRLSDGFQFNFSKNENNRVRAVRAF